MFSSRYRYGFIILLGGYSYLNTLFTEVQRYYGIDLGWFIILLLMLLITLLIWEGNRLLLPALNKLSIRLTKLRFLILFFLIGAVASIVNSMALTFIAGKWQHLSPSEMNIALKLAFTYGTRINLFMHILNAVTLYINEYKNKELEAEELKRITAQAQLQAIKNQVNPHFLFNNLNVLSGMVIKDNPDANKFIEEFSKVYRHILSSQDQELIPLETEIEFIKPYIFLLEKRFPDSIHIQLSITQQYKHALIVPATLQMLVENAIKHNTLSNAKPLYIEIAVNKTGDLFVKNNLQVKEQVEMSTQVGLKNIGLRYAFITGRAINVEKNTESYTITLPLIYRAS